VHRLGRVRTQFVSPYIVLYEITVSELLCCSLVNRLCAVRIKSTVVHLVPTAQVKEPVRQISIVIVFHCWSWYIKTATKALISWAGSHVIRLFYAVQFVYGMVV